MKILSVNSKLESFILTGYIEGKFTIYRNFFYQLIPPFNNISVFKVWNNQTLTGFTSGKIDFKTICVFEIDTAIIPDIKFLYSLIIDAHSETLQLIAHEIIHSTNYDEKIVLQLLPPTFDEAQPSLNQCIDKVKEVMN